MIKEKIKAIKNKLFKNKNLEIKKKKILIGILIFLGVFNIYLLFQNYSLENQLYTKNKIQNKISKQKIINNKYFGDNLKLKNYKETKYKISSEGNKIIQNIRNVHKSPVFIAPSYQDKELCAGYISELSKNIWGNKSIYSIGMQNQKKQKLAQAWELPYYYEAFGGKILIDLGKKFNLNKKDYLESIGVSDLKEFFAKAFSEEALFGDIGFLYSKTKYTNFLKNWNSNSHITKNMGISDFEIIISKFDQNKSNLENFIDNLGCSYNFKKYISLLENYKLYLNGDRIVFYKNDFYYLDENNILDDKVKFKYLDKITYKDITLAHFFEGKSHVDSLLKFSCSLEFYPINVIKINSRMIEKM